MNTYERRIVEKFEEKLDEIKGAIASVVNWMFIFFIITLMATCSTKNITEKMENHEKKQSLTKLDKLKVAFNLVLVFGIVVMICWWKWR